MRAFILAGGFATRLWPLTERRAKPLLPLQGKPLVSYTIEQIPSDIEVSLSTNAVFKEDFLAWSKGFKRGVDIIIEDAGHEGEKLGALGAVARWIETEKIDDDILLLAGDNYVGTDMGKFLTFFQGNPLIAGHNIGDHEAARQFGTIILEPGDGTLKRVRSFEEKPLHPKSTIVSTGWWVLPKSSLPVLQSFARSHPDNVGGIFEEFLKRGRPVDCFVFQEIWKDIGSFESYLALHRELVGERVIAHASATIDSASVLRGSVDLGAEVKIERSTLTDCIVFGDTLIQDSVLKRCIIDTGSKLSGIDLHDQMIRAKTVLNLSH